MAVNGDDVTVVIPNYNKLKTIRACLDSVFAQTVQPAEVIVIDDASTDGSREIAEGYPCRVIRLGGNTGPAGARNIGLASAETPLVFFLDSDTALEPEALENAVRAYRATPDCAMVQGVYHPDPLYDDGLVEAYRTAFEHFDRRQSTATFFSNTLIPKSVFHEAGGLDERLRDGEDFEFGTRVPARYRLVVTDTVVTRADDEDKFWACLWERFVRASTLPVIMMRARKLPRDGAVGFRLDMIGPGDRNRRRPPRVSSTLATLTLLSTPFIPFWPWIAAFTVAAATGFVAVNVPFFRFAHRHRGTGFLLFVVWMQLCYHASFFLGAGFGLVRIAWETARGRMDPAPLGTPQTAGARR